MSNNFYPKLDMLVLSHSSRTSYGPCKRKLEFRQFFGQSPTAKEDNFAGDVGKAMHEAMGAWFRTYDEKQAMLALLMHYPYEQEYLKAYNRDRSLEACYSTLLALLSWAQSQQYDLAKIKIANGEEKDCVEVPFAIRIVNSPLPIPVWVVGFLDLILWNEMTGRFRVVDIKTTRQTYDDARFQFDEQTIPYGIILEHALGRQIEEIDTSYLSAYLDLMNPKVQEYPFTRTRDDIRDWHYSLCDEIRQIARYYETGIFPRATDGQTCVSWNSKCPHFNECGIRDHAVLNRILMGEKRTGLFTNRAEPWITAELPYIGG